MSDPKCLWPFWQRRLPFIFLTAHLQALTGTVQCVFRSAEQPFQAETCTSFIWSALLLYPAFPQTKPVEKGKVCGSPVLQSLQLSIRYLKRELTGAITRSEVCLPSSVLTLTYKLDQSGQNLNLIINLLSASE